ncbi:MAG: glutamate-cysteine ligase family protein [Nannocystaceae bacterium]|nr:glutamate-cysteine ligase family protein [bacterium]
MTSAFHLFEVFGIEIELMLVDVDTLHVSPCCDRVLQAQAGEPACEVDNGVIGWSNELAAHVIELKTSGPVPSIDDAVATAFADDLRLVDRLARSCGARVLPTAMHPSMDPARESVLWPHDGQDIYATYDRVFGCSGHGWTNLQSCHINLPFADADEFGRLHAAIRAVLPLLPALAASSPFVEGRFDGTMDRRLGVYASNQKRVPSVIGDIIPEPVFTPEAYAREILQPIYDDIAPLDPHGELQFEWLNSRGAIARFDRNAIEIRVLDSQETPWADLAQARLVASLVEALAQERWVDAQQLRALPTSDLRRVFDRTVEHADAAIIDDPGLLLALGRDQTQLRADALWQELYSALPQRDDRLDAVLRRKLELGSLSRRILAATGESPHRRRLREVYADIADCGLQDRLFER